MNTDRLTDAFADEGTPLVRTDFDDEVAWQQVIRAATTPVDFDDPNNPDLTDDGYAPYLLVIDDPAFAGVTGALLAEAIDPTDEMAGYVLLADTRSMAEARAGSEITLDYVDLSLTSPEDAELFGSYLGRTFRCVTTEVASIEANLSIANMDFAEFADHVDPDGVFRGFNS